MLRNVNSSNTAHPSHLAATKMGCGPCRPTTTFIRGNKFAIVAIKYFTSQIEAKPLATITLESVKKFVWQNIICRFGVPRILTVDNGKQFDSDNFGNFCRSLETTIAFASVHHPESNGAVERANRVVFSAISKTLYHLRKGKWVEELPKIVWSRNTTASRATGFIPFKLLYREEAMLPEEAKHQSFECQNTLALDEEYSKETIKGTRLEAVQNINKYQEQTKKWRGSQVIRKDLQHRDLVLRKNLMQQM
jgi:hypothetical protein